MGKELLEIGYIQKAHGIKGEVFLKLYDGDASFLSEGMTFSIGNQEQTILKKRLVTGGVILKLEKIETRNESELLKAKKVFISKEAFKSAGGEEPYLNQLLGYKVFLKEEFKGVVVGFSETAAHDLVVVELATGGEIEIPYVDDFISSLDTLGEKLKVKCPKELFDLDFLEGAKK